MEDPCDANSLLTGRIRRIKGLSSVHFKLSDHCNHTCVHCYEVQGQKGELGTDEAKRVLDRLAESGAFLLTLGGGEVTLRHDLLEIVGHARSRGFAVILYTNAFTITPELARGLADHAVWQVHVSVYASRADIHDAVTCVPGSFERTLAGIRLLRAAGVNVLLKMPVMKQNFEEVEPLRRLADTLGCSVLATADLSAREDGSIEPVDMNIDMEQRQQLLARDGNPFTFDRDAIERARREPTCGIGHGSLVVQSNGEARPCTMLNVALGNAVQERPSDIVDGEEYRFFHSITGETLHGCRDCDLLPGCARCHGTAAAEAGDAFGPYRSACVAALARYRSANGAFVMLPAGDAARDALLGPFRIEAEGALRPIPDQRNEHDEAIARRFAWVRPKAEDHHAAMAAPSGERLVQIRVRRVPAAPPTSLEHHRGD